MAHRANQTAEIALHLAESNERGQYAELLQIGGVDRADKRLDQPLERLAAQAAADEMGHAFVGVVRARRNEVFHRRPKLADRTEDRRQGQRPKSRGGHHQEAVWQPVQPPATHDKCASIYRIGADQLVAQPESLTQTQAPGDGRNEVVGALLDLKTVFVDRRDAAAPPRTGLEERQVASGIEFHEPMRRRQSGDAAADDRDAPTGEFSRTH